jgi:hypothetical protein
LASTVAGAYIGEIGSGEGSLLRHFADKGIRVLGIEASPTAAAREAGVSTLRSPFDQHVARRLAEKAGRRTWSSPTTGFPTSTSRHSSTWSATHTAEDPP